MVYTVVIQKTFTALQGLKSTVRALEGLPPLVKDEGFRVTLHVGISFADNQLKDAGWFVDTDASQRVVDECCARLSHDKWTNMFEFRPTVELVSRYIFQQLSNEIDQLSYVELENQTIGVRTRYQQCR